MENISFRYKEEMMKSQSSLSIVSAASKGTYSGSLCYQKPASLPAMYSGPALNAQHLLPWPLCTPLLSLLLNLHGHPPPGNTFKVTAQTWIYMKMKCKDKKGKTNISLCVLLIIALLSKVVTVYVHGCMR